MKKNLFLFLFFCCANLSSYSQKANDSINHYYNIFTASKNSTELVKAYSYFNRNKDLLLESGDTISAIYNLRYIASIQRKLGLVFESEETSVSSLKFINSLSRSKVNTENKIGVLNHLGLIYKELNNYERALEYYNQVLDLVQNDKQKFLILNNKANIYKEQKKYTLAQTTFQKVYEFNLTIGDSTKIARSLDNLGLAKSKLHKSNGINDMLQALDIRKQLNNPIELFTSYNHLAEYYLDRTDNKNVEIHASLALAIAIESKNKEFELIALSYLLKIDKSDFVVSYQKLNDSIQDARSKSQLKFTSIKYNYNLEKQKKEEANLQLVKIQLEQEKEQKTKIKYQFLVLLILLSGAPIYILIRTKHKKDKLQQVYITEKRISKKVHDEVANDMYQVMTKLQSNVVNSEVVLDDLEDIYMKTRDISKANSTIDFNGPFEEVLNDLLLGYRSKTINIFTKDITTINWEEISSLKKTAIHRVLQELMTNMKKHSKATVVVVSFNQKNSRITIKYSDNGIGCTIKKRNGLQNAESRIETINGSINFESEPNKGFKATIKV